MIIRMKKHSSVEAAKLVARAFQNQGFDVHVKNGDGQLVIAVLGTGANYLAIGKLPGIARVERNSKLFNSKFAEFREAWQFFRGK